MWSLSLPASFLAWQERRRTLRDLRSFIDQDNKRLALSDTNPVNQAKIALALNDHERALHHWRVAMECHPAFARKSHDSLDVLIGLKLFDEAEMIMLQGKSNSPGDRFFAGGYALVAEERCDYVEALQRWQIVQRSFPGWWKGHAHTVACLRRLGKIKEAEEQARRAVQLFPDELYVGLEWGYSADARGDWDESIRRWEAFRDRFQNSHGDLGVARALEKLGRFEEADKRLEVARHRSPTSPEILIALARISYLRGDPEASARRWAKTRQRLPLLPFGYQGEIHLLREMQRFAEAEAVALEAIDRFRSEQWPVVEYATLSSDRQDWHQAAERWKTVRLEFPERGDGYLRGAEALSHLGREAEASALRHEHHRRSCG